MKSGAVSPIDNIALHLPPPRSGQQPESLNTSAEWVIVDATGPGIQFNWDHINDNLVGAQVVFALAQAGAYRARAYQQC